VYLVARSTATESVNYFVTTDFIKFKRLTYNFPEKSYNWLSTELVKWTTPEGKQLDGILYKPEDFDPRKKYPVIFYFYRKASSNLNSYMLPLECPGCIIDIPSYVSNGYLVFTPDIYFIKGKTGQSALSAISSAVSKLKELFYVNGSKIGIQGCSFSGFTTNYILTHSTLFAAACSASGLTDLISGYNSINSGLIKQSQFESGAYQIGGTLWEVPQNYIENTPVLFTNRLTTPLLMMHTTADVSIPFSNALELFLAAKRLGKKVWMLQYGGGNSHTLEGIEGRDFMLRMKQFFDFYLKDSLPPKWMLYGSSRNGDPSYNEFDLDSTRKIP
jgi:dipeptidyl aminopeptidase/acylaminoacyl peptidase